MRHKLRPRGPGKMTPGMEPGQGAWFPRRQAQGLLRADSRPPRAPQELKLKDEECERLSKVREQLEQELEELTASLFEVRCPASQGAGWALGLLGVPRLLTTPSSQEAHKMVREANMKQAASEKQLKEARGKVRPPPAQARPGLPPASQPASPAFLLPSQTLEWPGGAPRDGPTEVQKGAAEVMLPKFHCTTEILLEKGPLGAGRVPWSCPSFSLLLHSFYKAETSVWLWEAGQASSCLGARSPIHKLRGLSCSWLLGPLQWEARPAPRRGHLTECPGLQCDLGWATSPP